MSEDVHAGAQRLFESGREDVDTLQKSRSVACSVCPRGCRLSEGQRGFCRARVARGGAVVSESYGLLTALALDPIEKKPFARFMPGNTILSAGSYGCNMRCPFCQNHDISQTGAGGLGRLFHMPPAELVQKALSLAPQRNVGLAFTYNEPAVGYEYVRDASTLAKREGLVNAMVTNGWMTPATLDALLPAMDAFNIDLKCFTQEGYERLGGSLGDVKATIAAVAASGAHLEVTTLVVTGLSDDEDEMDAEAAWLASLSPGIPLHVSRSFPRWNWDEAAPSVQKVRALADVARRHLHHVYTGNI